MTSPRLGEAHRHEHAPNPLAGEPPPPYRTFPTPATAEPSPPVILVATKTLKSVEHDLLSLLPHLALAAGEPLAGKRRAKPPLFCELPPGTLFEKNQNFQGSNCKMYMNLQTANFKNS